MRNEGRVPSWGPRVLSGAMGVAIALYFGARAGTLAREGLPFTAAAIEVVSALFAAAFLAIALFPRLLSRLPTGNFDFADRGHVFALLVLLVTLFLVLGLGSFLEAAYGYESLVLKRENVEKVNAVDEEAIVGGIFYNLVAFVLPVVLWIAVVDGVPRRALGEALGLSASGIFKGALFGVALTIASFVALVAAGWLATLVGYEPPANDRALAIGRALSIPAVLIVSAGAAVSEEIFFRGFLAPRIGALAQAVLFGLAHLSYLNVAEVVVTFALGLAYGVFVRRTGNLWAPIVAHFTFNVTMLLAVRSLPIGA